MGDLKIKQFGELDDRDKFLFCPCGPCWYISDIKKNPRLEIDKFIVPGNLCQKCRGKIRHGFIIDGELTSQIKDIYLCLDCNTVYPVYNLSKYIGPQLPHNPYHRQN